MSLTFNFEAKEVIDKGRSTQEAIDTIKSWISENPLIPEIPDEMIILFLLSCNNVIDATKNTVTAFYKCKKHGPEMFDNRDMDSVELQKAMNTVIAASLPCRTKENNAIHFFKLLDTTYYNLVLHDAMKVAYMLLDITLRQNPPDGLIVIFDMKGLGLMHLTRLKPAVVQKFFQFLQEAMPVQLKAIHILNTVYFFDKIMSIVKVFMKSELMGLIKTHPPGMDMDTFFKEHIPANCMPSDYGGELPSIDELQNRTVKQFHDLKPYFEIEEQMRKKP